MTETIEKVRTSAFDAAKYLDTPESQAELLTDALETGDRAYILDALGIIARARGMTALQKETGLNRATLYAALAPGGNPTLETILSVLGALGLKLTVGMTDRELHQLPGGKSISKRPVSSAKKKTRKRARIAA